MAALRYLSGFGSHFASEALPGALPEGQNAPQHPKYGLYTEQLSGTAFTAPRPENRRSWLYRIRPSAAHPPYARMPDGFLRSGPFNEVDAAPNRLVWGSDWPHIWPQPGGPNGKSKNPPMPNDGDLFDTFVRWVPDEKLRQRILVDNPAELYDFK